MLQSIMGYGYPPRCLPHGILSNVAKHYGIWVPPHPQVWTDWKHYLPDPSDAGGHKLSGYVCDGWVYIEDLAEKRVRSSEYERKKERKKSVC